MEGMETATMITKFTREFAIVDFNESKYFVSNYLTQFYTVVHQRFKEIFVLLIY